MNKIGIIVDGQGEYCSFKQRFNNDNIKILKTDGPRGHLAKIEDIIIRSKKQINMLKCQGCSSAILLLDLEERNIDYETLLQQAENFIDKNKFEIGISVAIANKMIENWYLADIAYLSTQKKYLKRQKKQKNYEGAHGKKEIKKLFLHGYDYNEVTHGKELFNTMRFEYAKKYSKSLNDFLIMLGNIIKTF